MNKRILILSPSFSPNIGGVETHLDDLTTSLDKRNYKIFVHTYSPITTKNTDWKGFEKRGENIQIWRHRWIGHNIFHFVENYPLLDFLYLTPYLLIETFFWMIKNHRKVDVIHAQGLNCAIIGLFLKINFKKRLIVSTHAIYGFKSQSLTAKMVAKILNFADRILCLSNGSLQELTRINIEKSKLTRYRYWLDLALFKPKILKHSIYKQKKFQILFVGRLIEKKGVRVLCKVAQKLTRFHFTFIGTGPEEVFLQQYNLKVKNISLILNLPNKKLPEYYQQADLLCVPSLYEEGFGRVAMEALACSLPVLSSNKGGLKEFITSQVGLLLKPTVNSFSQAILKYHNNPKLLYNLKKNCRKKALSLFSEKNLNSVIKAYE